MINVITFEPKNEPQVVWSSGDVKVSAIRSTHIPGHASYRVDTPAGSVVIGGDAGNDVLAPPRATSTSDQVEKLAKGVDIIVHSTMHPVMGPTGTAECRRRFFIARARPRSRRNGEAGGREVSHAHAYGPGDRSGTLKAPEDSGRPSDGSGLPESGRGERIYRQHCRGDRSRKRPPSGEMNKVFDGRCAETVLLPQLVNY